MSEAIVVFMTAANAEEARRIAERLVETRLSACVQILPHIESIYRWKDQVQHETEVLLLAKTTAERFDELEKEVRALHSYETPEIVAVPMTKVAAPYLDWLVSEVRTDSKET